MAREALVELGYSGKGICLALPSDMVLTGRVGCDNLPRRDRHLAMLYRLEEQLPVEAEDLTAEFMAPVGGRSLGLAVRTSQVAELTGALSEAGVETAVIVPAALLALWRGTRAAGGAQYALVARNAHIDVFRMQAARPAQWYCTGADPRPLAQCLRAQMLIDPPESAGPGAVVLGSVDTACSHALSAEVGLEIETIEQFDVHAEIAQAARDALAGRRAGWVNFSHGELAGRTDSQKLARPIRTAVVLSVVLLAMLTGLFYLRSAQYDSIARQSRQRQRDAYLRAYPARRVPVSVPAALASELRRLTGTTAGNEMPATPAGLDTLRTVLAALDGQVRLRIIDLRIDPAELTLRGQCRDHSGAQAVAQSLAEAGLIVETPITEQLARRGVGFTIFARLPGPEEQP